MELYQTILIKRDNKLFVGGYKSEKPKKDSPQAVYVNWQSSYTEYEVYENQIEAFEIFVNRLCATKNDVSIEKGIEIPSDRVEIKRNPFDGVYYAFLIEKKEEVNSIRKCSREVSKWVKEYVELSYILAMNGYKDEKLYDLISEYFKSLSEFNSPKEQVKTDNQDELWDELTYIISEAFVNKDKLTDLKEKLKKNN